jgi:hypothetical protein
VTRFSLEHRKDWGKTILQIQGLVTRFWKNGVYPHSINTLLMRIEQQLPTLIGLVPVKPPLRLPFSGSARDFLNAFNSGDSGVNVWISSKTEGQAAAKYVELPQGMPAE